jgi:hypothetical protein
LSGRFLTVVTVKRKSVDVRRSEKSLTKNTKKRQSGSSTTTTQANTQQKCDE